jgi:hypothetical protein
LSLLSSNPIANCHRPPSNAVLDEDDDDDDDDDDVPLQPLPPSCLYDDGMGVVVPVAIGKSNHIDNDDAASSSAAAAAAAISRRPRTVILTGNERCQQIDYRDDQNHGNDDDDDDLASTMMILSRLDIEIQGIGRPRNQSKVRQSLEDDYRDMMRRLSAFIATAKRYHQSLQKVQAAKQKVSCIIVVCGYGCGSVLAFCANTMNLSAHSFLTTIRWFDPWRIWPVVIPLRTPFLLRAPILLLRRQ